MEETTWVTSVYMVGSYHIKMYLEETEYKSKDGTHVALDRDTSGGLSRTK
jgi:hypothetical protein